MCSQQPKGSIHNDSSEAPRISACFHCWHEKTKSVHFNFLTDAYFIPACQLHENVTKKTLILLTVTCMDCGTMYVTDFEEYHPHMALENRDVYQFFLEYEMQTPIEDYECNE